MFDIFKDTSDDELKSIYNDILKSEEDGLRAKSLDFYAENLREICKFKMFAQAPSFAKELFYEEVAKRYFNTP